MLRMLKGKLRRFNRVRRFWAKLKIALKRALFKRKLVVRNNLSKTGFLGDNFFGYYDKNPLMNNLMIVHNAKNTSISRERYRKIAIIIYDIKNEKNVLSLETEAFNWQQGARAQWLDGKNLIFNDVFEGKLISRKVNIVTRDEVRYSAPVCDCWGNKFGISVDFNVLNKTSKDYSYNLKVDRRKPEPIKYVDFNKGEIKELVSIENIPGLSDEYDKFEINHVMISPEGKKFIFIVRYVKNGNRFDSLYCYHLEGGGIFCLLKDTVVSHFCWINESELFGFFSSGGDLLYQTITVTGGIKDKHYKLSEYGDGHPTIIDESYLIVDTYPNEAGVQHLILYNYIKKTPPTILENLYHPLKYSFENRCDLHPRYSPESNLLFFDTVHFGKRELCWFPVGSLVKQ